MSEHYVNSFLNSSSNITPSTQNFLKSIRYDTMIDEEDMFSLTLLPICKENEFVSTIHAISNSLDNLSKSDEISIILEKISHHLKKGKMLKAGSCLEDFQSKFSDLIKVNCQPTSNATCMFKKTKKNFRETTSLCNQLISTISSKVARDNHQEEKSSEFGHGAMPSEFPSSYEPIKLDNAEKIEKLINLFKKTVTLWLNTLIMTILQLLSESRQEDVVKTTIRTLINYSKTSYPVCVAIIGAGGINCLISVCYSLRTIAYDAIKLCVLLSTNCPSVLQFFIKAGFFELSVEIFVRKVDDYSELVKMEMALAISALTFPDFNQREPKLRLSGTLHGNDNLIPDLIGGIVAVCRKTTMNDVLMACVSVLANLVIYEPSAVESVVQSNALPILVDACKNRGLGNNLFVKDWIACLMALVADHQCYHRHMLDSNCLGLLLEYLLQPIIPLSVRTDIATAMRVLQKTIVSLTRLSLTSGVSAIISSNNGIDRLRQLSVGFDCPRVRIAAARGVEFIQTRLCIDETCSEKV